jgi:hypothetical protein
MEQLPQPPLYPMLAEHPKHNLHLVLASPPSSHSSSTYLPQSRYTCTRTSNQTLNSILSRSSHSSIWQSRRTHLSSQQDTLIHSNSSYPTLSRANLYHKQLSLHYCNILCKYWKRITLDHIIIWINGIFIYIFMNVWCVWCTKIYGEEEGLKCIVQTGITLDNAILCHLGQCHQAVC